MWRVPHRRPRWNYLRMCGEYHFSKPITTIGRGLPPRARRIRMNNHPNPVEIGTTSACAENTYDPYRNGKPPWNYLRVCGEYTENLGGVHPRWELPPRVRRIPLAGPHEGFHPGTTSACAENTVEDGVIANLGGNYLRVRGEYSSSTILPRSHWELPPCARENTGIPATAVGRFWNYLRVRGEYRFGLPPPRWTGELPPRARRIPQGFGLGRSTPGTTSACAENTCCITRNVWLVGTTSACAENTEKHWSVSGIFWNYLRVRGEYSWWRTMILGGKELPPRARRILALAHVVFRHAGTTSACAENTGLGCHRPAGLENYLRVRGEYHKVLVWGVRPLELPPRARRIPVASHATCGWWELPPRARRIRKGPLLIGDDLGTTSACAENTWGLMSTLRLLRNYLRVRGEYPQSAGRCRKPLELPPRARRIQRISFINPDLNGTTSACAENTTSSVVAVAMMGNYLRMRGEYNHNTTSPGETWELPPHARRIPLTLRSISI